MTTSTRDALDVLMDDHRRMQALVAEISTTTDDGAARDLADMAIAPTRPHPSAPHSELFHNTVGTGAAFVDRVKEALTGHMTG
jgi:hypothetical protein